MRKYKITWWDDHGTGATLLGADNIGLALISWVRDEQNQNRDVFKVEEIHVPRRGFTLASVPSIRQRVKSRHAHRATTPSVVV